MSWVMFVGFVAKCLYFNGQAMVGTKTLDLVIICNLERLLNEIVLRTVSSLLLTSSTGCFGNKHKISPTQIWTTQLSRNVMWLGTTRCELNMF